MTPDLTHPDEKKDAELRAFAKGGDMTPLEILKQARELISVPERWTKRNSARNNFGENVRYCDPTACSWCILGAIWRTAGSMYGELPDGAETLLRRLVGDGPDAISDFNDAHSHAEVLDLVDRAIAAAEGGR